MKKTRQPGLLFIFITLFLDILGIGIVVPILPKLVTQFFGGDLSLGAHYFGIIIASYAFMQFVFAPLLGTLSDTYGRRPILLLSSLGSGIDYLVMAFAPNFGWLLGARIISGITGANITVGLAYIADVTPPEKRAQSFGLVGAAFGLGFVLGPALGGILGKYHMNWPFYAAALMTLTNVIYGWFVLPESLPKEHRAPINLKKANPVGSALLLRQHPFILGLSVMFFLANLAQQCLQNVWVLFTAYRFHWDTLQTGLSLAMVGLLSAVVQGGLMRRIIPKLGERKAIILGLSLGIVSFVLYGLATQGWMMYAVMFISSLAGIAGPAAQGLISRQVGPSEQGALQGALSSVTTLTRVIGPLIATGLFSYFTAATTPVHMDGAPFFLGAFLLAMALLTASSLFKKHQDEAAPSLAEVLAKG